ncbi:MAG: hypothetical protein M3024_00140 [Candidatus Dormibacteraeota bacterium]|nr:hypothetical protein [Candidatus Dormibacteraeota bacterium]
MRPRTTARLDCNGRPFQWEIELDWEGEEGRAFDFQARGRHGWFRPAKATVLRHGLEPGREGVELSVESNRSGELPSIMVGLKRAEAREPGAA